MSSGDSQKQSTAQKPAIGASKSDDYAQRHDSVVRRHHHQRSPSLPNRPVFDRILIKSPNSNVGTITKSTIQSGDLISPTHRTESYNGLNRPPLRLENLTDGHHPHLCICPPDPKIPRPRNSFILYRQHHQASVTAQHPGYSNPEISKILGQQWHNLPDEEKKRWQALAEEEKSRHSRQYPAYRYQPKRNAQARGSTNELSLSPTDRLICERCGGRNMAIPIPLRTNSFDQNHRSASIPSSSTPTAFLAPDSNALSGFQSLNVNSPPMLERRGSYMHGVTPPHHFQQAVSDDTSPELALRKRRRINLEEQPLFTHLSQYSFDTANGQRKEILGPEFGFSKPASVAGDAQARRQTLPGIQYTTTVSAPPDHGWLIPSRGPSELPFSSQRQSMNGDFIKLPPIQPRHNLLQGPGETRRSFIPPSMQNSTFESNFQYKIQLLKRIVPPAPLGLWSRRGPFIVLEGDDRQTVGDVSLWLKKALEETCDQSIKLLAGPDAEPCENVQTQDMVKCHVFAADLLLKSEQILALLEDAQGSDGQESSDQDDASCNSCLPGKAGQTLGTPSSSANVNTPCSPGVNATSSKKPVVMISNYSLFASNHFAQCIPITATQSYHYSDHWQWIAEQWRGSIGPDLTIYIQTTRQDASQPDAAVEMVENDLLVVRQDAIAIGQALTDGETSSMRRLKFEVDEWIRAFGLRGR